jgi:hypothetical protein
VQRLVDELVQRTYELAAERNISVEAAGAIVRQELERVLRQSRVPLVAEDPAPVSELLEQ